MSDEIKLKKKSNKNDGKSLLPCWSYGTKKLILPLVTITVVLSFFNYNSYSLLLTIIMMCMCAVEKKNEI